MINVIASDDFADVVPGTPTSITGRDWVNDLGGESAVTFDGISSQITPHYNSPGYLNSNVGHNRVAQNTYRADHADAPNGGNKVGISADFILGASSSSYIEPRIQDSGHHITVIFSVSSGVRITGSMFSVNNISVPFPDFGQLTVGVESSCYAITEDIEGGVRVHIGVDGEEMTHDIMNTNYQLENFDSLATIQTRFNFGSQYGCKLNSMKIVYIGEGSGSGSILTQMGRMHPLLMSTKRGRRILKRKRRDE